MTTDPPLAIAVASSAEDMETARQLFQEYAASLDIDLSFQDFGEELRSLPGEYAFPGGRLILAWHGDEAAGCVALRRFTRTTCEMKRLFVRPQFRGLGIGRQLAEEVIRQAQRMGYRRMVLDTIGSMRTAIWLYISLGFTEILSYRYNPVPGARFFSLDLDRPRP